MALLSPCVVLYFAVGGANVILPGSNRCFDCGLLPQLRPLFGLCVGPGFASASPNANAGPVRVALATGYLLLFKV